MTVSAQTSVNIYQISRCHICCPVVIIYEDGDLTWISATCISGRVLLHVHWSERLLLRIYHVLEVIPTHTMTDELVINQKEYGREKTVASFSFVC